MNIIQLRLDTAHSTEIIEQGLTLDSFLNGDLNLELAHKLGSTIGFDKDYLWIEKTITDEIEDLPEDLEISIYREIALLNGIASLSDSTQMRISKLTGNFHDGGDDLDYKGSYLMILATFIEENITGFSIE